MKNYLALFFILVFLRSSLSQNLIPNGDFELYNCLPTNLSQTNCLLDWLNPTWASPDFYNIYATGNAKSPNTSLGFVKPYSGDGFAGLYVLCTGCNSHQFREYLTAPLISPLEIGETYLLSFAISNGESSQESISSISSFGITFLEQYFTFPTESMIFSTNHPAPLPDLPQLTIPGSPWSTDWQIINLEFTPSRNFKFIMFGNLKNNKETQYIKQIPNIGSDSVSYYFLDKISLTKTSDNKSVLDMPNVFSPNKDGINDTFIPVKYKNLKNVHFYVTNRWGNIVFETEDLTNGWDGKFKDVECDEGVYFWNIQYKDFMSKDINTHGYLTLTR